MKRPDPIKLNASISAVFPAFNDDATIPSMVLSAILILRQVCDDYEIIVTDDGSMDHTKLLLDEMATRFPELRVLYHPSNRGYGQALRTGFSAAVKDWIFYTDGDAQYDPFELRDLAEKATDEVDIVNGYKIARQDSLLRKVIGRLYHHTVQKAFGFSLRDVNCDFRLFRRAILEHVQLESSSGTLGLEFVKKCQAAGYRFVEVPVHHYARPHGNSQFFHWRPLVQTARDLVTLWEKTDY